MAVDEEETGGGGGGSTGEEKKRGERRRYGVYRWRGRYVHAMCTRADMRLAAGGRGRRGRRCTSRGVKTKGEREGKNSSLENIYTRRRPATGVPIKLVVALARVRANTNIHVSPGFRRGGARVGRGK